MTREELVALFADVIGLRLRPVETDTLLQAVDNYAESCVDLAISAFAKGASQTIREALTGGQTGG